MTKLFETTTINGLEIKNRFVRSATWERMAEEDGTCTPQLIALMEDLAKGQVGLIISGHAYIRKDGKAGPCQLGIYHDSLIETLRGMTAAVHEQGGKIVAQLAHSGCMASQKITGQSPFTLSITGNMPQREYHEAGQEDLKQLISDFASAARRAQEAGFDGVQLHAAHGYLLSQSLSPYFNQRTDTYGGSLENRMRLLMEVVSDIRQTVGPIYPIMIKINNSDYLDNGLTLDESVQVVRRLQNVGLDAVEVSGGTIASGDRQPSRFKINTEDKEAYFRDAAKQYKKELTIPVMLVGGVRSFGLAEKLFEQGVADYFSMCRPFIREPHLIKRWMDGDLQRASCLSDNQCAMAIRKGEALHCVVEEKGSQQT